MRARRFRGMGEFAESEIWTPDDGPRPGERFSRKVQPFAGLWFDAVDSGLWNRMFATGPSQTGKTLNCTVIPIMYHLFEMKEKVIFSAPIMEICADKWNRDIKPTIERSRYRDLLPTGGRGSRGGTPSAIQFAHGPELRFIPGGGSDKTKSSYTSRVLVMTEVDGMDDAGANSREADTIEQLEARVRAHGKRKRVYGECTTSIDVGRIWQEWLKGTTSRIYMPCPHCGQAVHPTRESLRGWQDAQTEHEAEQNSAIFCPQCGEAWSEEERISANLRSFLVHRDQTVDQNGVVCGALPPTNTLGFRWDVINSSFATMGDIGAEEWRSARSVDEENAEKKMRQFIWALPHSPSAMDVTPLEVSAIVARVGHGARGIVPDGVSKITVGVDVGKWLLHWVATAWMSDGSPHVFDYGRQEVASKELGTERAIQAALRELRDMFAAGWKQGDGLKPPSAVWVDSGYMTDVVYSFAREAGAGYMPSDGLGQGQEYRQNYNRPKTTGTTVRHVGEGYHFAWLPTKQVTLAEVHADHWKTFVHERLTTPLGEPGALTLFTAGPSEHLSFAKHLTAERQVNEFVAGKGNVVKWVRERPNNHWFDALYNSCAAGHFCGARLVRDAARPVIEVDALPGKSRIRELRFRR